MSINYLERVEKILYENNISLIKQKEYLLQENKERRRYSLRYENKI